MTFIRYTKAAAYMMTIFMLSFVGMHCAATLSSPSSAVSDSPAVTKNEDRETNKLRNDIVTQAKKHLGSKYKYAGKGPKVFDCSGLTHYVYKQFDITLGGGSRHQINQGKKLPGIVSAKPGDLVFFSRHEKGQGPVNHVAIVVSNSPDELYIIHSTSRGVVIDEVYSSSYWNSRLLQARYVLDE